MIHVTVATADCKVSSEPATLLETFGLGSCIAVAIHDPVAKVGGMLHFMLPGSDGNGTAPNPFMYADTGIPWLFRRAYDLGAEKRRITVRAVGGAQVMDGHEVFQIGKRNYLAMKKILWKAGVLIGAEAVGGSIARTVRLDVGTGRLTVYTAGQEEYALATNSPQRERQCQYAS